MSDLAIMRDNDLFSRLHLFWGVQLKTLKKFLQVCEERALAAGAILIAPERSNDKLYVILSGCLDVRLDSPTAPSLVKLTVGECVGEMSIIDRENPSAYVLAAEDSLLLVISQENLWAMVNASHEVAKNLLLILSRRLRDGNVVISDSTEMIRQIEEVALIDALTGLHNRRWLDDVLERVALRCVNDGRQFSLVMADIDHFKIYNDKHGHLNGDAALRSVANVLRKNLRPNDMIARYGGEEFVILLPGTGTEGGTVVAERLRRGVEEARVRNTRDEELPSLTVSLGLAEMPPGDAVEEVLEAADRALYRAKGNGRNQVST